MAIVCGTDLSEASLTALTAAIAVAKRRGDAELWVVHVIDSEDTAVREALAAAARTRIEEEGRRLAGDRLGLRIAVMAGPVASTLLAFAETEGAELLVVAAKGRTNAPHEHVGSAAHRIAQTATMPVLVVRDAAPFVAWADGQRPLRVMIGVDESASCEPALRFTRVARAAGPTDVILGHVYYVDEAARRYGLRASSLVDANPEIERLLHRDLLQRLGPVEGEGTVTARPMRGLGRIGDHLLELADREAVDVVFIGTHHKGGIGKLSSVSSLVLHDAKQSVLCVPPTADLEELALPRFRVAVVATDLSDFGNRAIAYAYGLIGDKGEVHLVHVVDGEDADRDQLTAKLREVAPHVVGGVTTIAHVIAGDDPAQAVAETAERVGADVICIASRGRAGITRALVGSVADKLLRACRRPVLVLRPPTD